MQQVNGQCSIVEVMPALLEKWLDAGELVDLGAARELSGARLSLAVKLVHGALDELEVFLDLFLILQVVFQLRQEQVALRLQ